MLSDTVSVLSMIEPFMRIINSPDILNHAHHSHKIAPALHNLFEKTHAENTNDNQNKEITKINK